MNRLSVSALALLAGLSTAFAQQTSTGSSSLGPIGFVQYPSSQRILSVPTSNVSVGLPPGNVVVIYNTGTNVADIALGDSSVKVVGAQYPVNPGTWRAFSVGTNTFIAAVGPSGATTLSIQGGGGFPPNAAGGTSNGAAPPALTGGAAARSAIGAAASGANADITSLSALTTPLSIAQGGTGANDTASLRTNIAAAASGVNSDIITLNGLTTPLSVAQGGTGQTTLTGLRPLIGAAASGANSDITSLAGLSTPLPLNEGGLGATTQSGARTTIGAAASGANSDITSLTGITNPTFGHNASATGLYDSAIGENVTSSGSESSVTGEQGNDWGRSDIDVRGAGIPSGSTAVQAGSIVLWGVASSTAGVRLTALGSTGITFATCMGINDNSVYSMNLILTVKDRTTPSKTETWVNQAVMMTRGSGAGTTATTSGTLPTPIPSSGGIGGTWFIGPDTTTGCMNLVYTPPGGNTDSLVMTARAIDSEQ